MLNGGWVASSRFIEKNIVDKHRNLHGVRETRIFLFTANERATTNPTNRIKRSTHKKKIKQFVWEKREICIRPFGNAVENQSNDCDWPDCLKLNGFWLGLSPQ